MLPSLSEPSRYRDRYFVGDEMAPSLTTWVNGISNEPLDMVVFANDVTRLPLSRCEGVHGMVFVGEIV